MAKKKSLGTTILSLFLCIMVLAGAVGLLSSLTDAVEPVDPNPSVANEKQYSYAVISDIHQRETSYREGNEDFINAVDKLEQLDLEYVFIAGDVGYDSYESELQIYKNVIAESELTFYPVRGNHDATISDEVWKSYAGVDENFEIVKGNDVFLGMSLYETNSTSPSGATPYGENATWLLGKLEEHKGKRIAVIMHLPMPGAAGLLPGHATYNAYGFTADSAEAASLRAAFENTDNVTVYSGHTHFEFAVEESYPNVNVYDVENKNVNLVHVPSCAYPRNASGAEVQEKSQCYIVDVYKDKIVLRGYDLKVGAYIADYVYTLNKDGSVIRVGDETPPDDSSSGTTEPVSVTAIAGSMLPVNGTVYGGVCGGSGAHQLKSTVAANYDITFRDLSLTSTETGIYLSNAGVSLKLRLEGSNSISVSAANQRAISSSGQTGNEIIGVGSDAVLNLSTPTGGNSAIIKGDWTIRNASVAATGAVNSAGGIQIVSTGITIAESGFFFLNSSQVRVIACDHGYITVNMGACIPGTSVVTVAGFSDEGYTFTGFTVGGVAASTTDTFTFPAEGGLLSFQGVFSKA